MQSKSYKAYARRAQRITGGDGIEFVRCHICSKHLRVISGRHLSTHGTDRETYIEEHRLTLYQLCAKDFRRYIVLARTLIPMASATAR